MARINSDGFGSSGSGMKISDESDKEASNHSEVGSGTRSMQGSEKSLAEREGLGENHARADLYAVGEVMFLEDGIALPIRRKAALFIFVAFSPSMHAQLQRFESSSSTPPASLLPIEKSDSRRAPHPLPKIRDGPDRSSSFFRNRYVLVAYTS